MGEDLVRFRRLLATVAVPPAPSNVAVNLTPGEHRRVHKDANAAVRTNTRRFQERSASVA